MRKILFVCVNDEFDLELGKLRKLQFNCSNDT